MGVAKNVGRDRWPKQGQYLGKRAQVCFDYDSTRTEMGTIVRDDAEEPFVTIISLDRGKVVLATECQYSPL